MVVGHSLPDSLIPKVCQVFTSVFPFISFTNNHEYKECLRVRSTCTLVSGKMSLIQEQETRFLIYCKSFFSSGTYYILNSELQNMILETVHNKI